MRTRHTWSAVISPLSGLFLSTRNCGQEFLMKKIYKAVCCGAVLCSRSKPFPPYGGVRRTAGGGFWGYCGIGVNCKTRPRYSALTTPSGGACHPSGGGEYPVPQHPSSCRQCSAVDLNHSPPPEGYAEGGGWFLGGIAALVSTVRRDTQHVYQHLIN